MNTNSVRGPAMGRSFLAGAMLALLASAIGAAGALVAGVPGALAACALALVAGGLLLPRFGARLFAPATAAPAAQKPAAAEAKAAPAPAIPEDRTDPLTGLANENGFLAWLQERTGRIEEDSKGIVVLVANLDAFEQLTKTRGKQMADSVLVEVARRVSTFSGDEGIAARVAGDEIMAVATVVPERALEYAEERAGTMAETICRPAETSSGALWIGGSVGAAVGKPSEGESVYARAKKALVEARRLGQGRYIVDAGK